MIENDDGFYICFDWNEKSLISAGNEVLEVNQ